MSDEPPTQAALDIEAIVREVLARIAPPRKEPEPAREPNNISPAKQAKKTVASLAIDERVVTLRLLDGRLTNVQELVVPPRAVVTPAVRDRLKELKISLSYRVSNGSPAAARTPLVLGVAATTFDPTGLVRWLLGEAWEVQQLARMGLPVMIDEMAREVALSGRPGLLLTDRVEAAVCLANRHRGVRAAGGTNVSSVRRAAETIGLNLLVVRGDMSPFEAQQTVREFVRRVPCVCPEDLRAALA